MTSRRSYSGLMRLPAWGLYRDGLLVASVRAKEPGHAWTLFMDHGLAEKGDQVKRIEAVLAGRWRPVDD
jgi:hypothetical protein